MNIKSLLLSGLALGCSTLVLTADDSTDATSQWPGWRGPLGTGLAPKANPPVEWSETKNVKWKVALPGTGTSTPVIWQDKIYILTAMPVAETSASAAPPAAPAAARPAPERPAATQAETRQRPTGENVELGTPPTRGPRVQEQERGQRGRGGGFGGGGEPQQEHRFVLMALDRATGKTLWERTARVEVPHEGHHRDHGHASGSPVTDGEHLIVFFGSQGLYGYDMEGKKLWEKDLGKMRMRGGFGEGSSPALHGNTVVVAWDHEGDSFIAAFDKRDGRELWRRDRDEASNWSTPLIIESEGRVEVVVNGSNFVHSYDLATGKSLWKASGQTTNAIPSPVTGHGRVYVTSGFRGSAMQAIQLGKEGDLSGTDAIVWSHNRGTPYVPSPLLYGDSLYAIAGNNSRLTLFDAKDGKVHFEAETMEGMSGVYASPIGAANRVYFLGRDGGAVVLENGATMKVLATNRLDDGFDASPAAVGNELYLRGKQHLYCLVAQ